MELKKGDKILIRNKPDTWSCSTNGKYPLKVCNDFPLLIEVLDFIKKKDSASVIDVNGFGWSILNTDNFKIINNSEKMTIFKTKEILNRKVTVCINVANNNLITAGYSVTHPDDTFDDKISKKISLGRALKDKTNILEPMILGEGMDKKFILYSIADHVLNNIENGKTVINGIRK